MAVHKVLSPYSKLTAYYHAMDLDKVCVNMCAINMCLNGMFGHVVHANSLSLEVYGGYVIYLRNNIPCIHPLKIEEAEKSIKKKPAPIMKGDQLSMF